MIEIKFENMKLLKDERTVKIKGKYKGKRIEIILSILQLAKLWNTDKKVLEKLNDPEFDLGYIDLLEYECKETRKMISKFPNVNLPKNKIEIPYPYVDTRPTKQHTIMISGMDLCGWDNEGIYIYFPEELYPNELKEKKFDFILKQNSIELKPRN
jgi:hypothetical protein